MATLITMPAIAADSTSAVLGSWLVGVGTDLAAGDALADIETEKATVEFEAPEAGTLARVLVESGEEVAVGAPIAVLLAGGEGDAEVAELLGQAASGPQSEAGAAPDAAVPGPGAAASSASTSSAAGAENPRTFASPLARKLAKEAGLDLASLVGTGPSGRVLRADVDAAIAQQSADALSQAAPAAAQATPAPAATSQTGAAAPSPHPTSGTKNGPGAPVPAGAAELPVSRMRQAIARRLTQSKSTVPHFYLGAEVRMDALLALRKQVNAAAPRKITVNDLVVKAVAVALTQVPEANVRWDEGRILRFDHADVSVAIATEDGLVTPVVTGADLASVSDLSSRVADFVRRAQENRLKPAEIEGGSFSVSNLGMFGTREFTAILNPPQAGILAVGAATPQPVVDEDGSLGVATVMKVTLSADHRVIDGAVAARWMNAFVQAMQNPLSLLV